ncbi:MAG: M48 family metallopeptidase [Nitriliruptoraceae bacterium]
MHNGGSSGATTIEHRQVGADAPALEIHRSWRRQRSATVDLRNGRLIARLPAGLSPAVEERLLNDLIPKALKRDRARQLASDTDLYRRACRLADTYLDGLRPASVTWSARMGRQWGSCTPATASIRISHTLAGMPDYVLDYLLVHELAHLRERRHNATFNDLVARYPDRDKAQAYLDGFLHGQREAAIAHALACERSMATPPDSVGDYVPPVGVSVPSSSPGWSSDSCGVDSGVSPVGG